MITGCGVCDKQYGLMTCSSCRAISYCSSEHQAEHREIHEEACNEVASEREDMEIEEQNLRDSDDDPFDKSVGRFWSLRETRDYMRARISLVKALQKIDTQASVQMQLDHLMDVLRLCPDDEMHIQDCVLSLLLRLGRDQECYNFLKLWQIKWHDAFYVSPCPYSKVKDANAFEPIDLFCDRGNFSHQVHVALVKFRLFLDLSALRYSGMPAIAGKVPREVLETIQGYALCTSIVAKGKNNILPQRLPNLIKKVKKQIRVLCEYIDRKNKHFWPTLLEPGVYLQVRPHLISTGSVAEAVDILRDSYQAWVETPGALRLVKTLKDQGFKAW